MTSTRTSRSTASLWTAGLLGAALLLSPAGNLAQAATKKTVPKKTVAKKPSKTVAKKPVKTAKRPAPAKGAKRVGGLLLPNGRPPIAAVPFVNLPVSKNPALPSAVDANAAFAKVQPGNGVFSILIIGSDARPNEKPEKTRADSIHLFLYSPSQKKGTLVGFARDSYVSSSTGNRKITEVLSTAGPDELLKTVNGITGLNTKRWILTGFAGFTSMIDQVGGVNVLVKPKINDNTSAATFAEGWFTMNGKAALAYARARKSLPNGDFDRSLNQAKILIYGMARMREQVGEMTTLTQWVNIIRKYTVTNAAAGDWLYLAQVARSIDPASLSSIVVPGTYDKIDGSEVVRITESKAKAIFTDLADGVLSSQSVAEAVPTPTVTPPDDATPAVTTVAPVPAAQTTVAPVPAAPTTVAGA